jgi:hypothetical protein
MDPVLNNVIINQYVRVNFNLFDLTTDVISSLNCFTFDNCIKITVDIFELLLLLEKSKPLRLAEARTVSPAALQDLCWSTPHSLIPLGVLSASSSPSYDIYFLDDVKNLTTDLFS